MTTLPGAATLALSRCDLLERRVAELEQMSTWLQQQLAHTWHVLNERTQLLLEESVNDCPGGTFICVKCWSWSAAHQSCECGKNQRYIDQPGMHRNGADGPSAGDPPLQCPDATRGAPLTAEQGTSATISGTPSTAPACAPPTSSTAEATGAGAYLSLDPEPLKVGDSVVRTEPDIRGRRNRSGKVTRISDSHGDLNILFEDDDGAVLAWCNPVELVPLNCIVTPSVDHGGGIRPGDRCVVYTGGVPCIKPGTVVERVGERWRVQIDRASTCVVGEEEMVMVPMEWT